MFGNNRGDDTAKSEERLDIVSLPYLLTSPPNSYFTFDDSLKFMLSEVRNKSCDKKLITIYGDVSLYKSTKDVLCGDTLSVSSIEKDVAKYNKKFNHFKKNGDLAIAWSKLSDTEEYNQFKRFINAILFSTDKLQALKEFLPSQSEKALQDLLAIELIQSIQEKIPKIKEEQIKKNESKLTKQANKLANKHTAELLSNRIIKKTVKDAGLNGDDVYAREKSQILADLKEKLAFALDEYIAREWAGFFTLSYLRDPNRLNQLFGLSLPLDCKVDPIFMYPGMDLMFSAFSLLEKLYIDHQGQLNLLAIEKPVRMEDIAIPLECQPGKPKYENQSDASSDTSEDSKSETMGDGTTNEQSENHKKGKKKTTGSQQLPIEHGGEGKGHAEFKASSPPTHLVTLGCFANKASDMSVKLSLDCGKIAEGLTTLIKYGISEQIIKIDSDNHVYCKFSVTKKSAHVLDYVRIEAKIERALKDFLEDPEESTASFVYPGYEIHIQMFADRKLSSKPMPAPLC